MEWVSGCSSWFVSRRAFFLHCIAGTGSKVLARPVPTRPQLWILWPDPTRSDGKFWPGERIVEWNMESWSSSSPLDQPFMLLSTTLSPKKLCLCTKIVEKPNIIYHSKLAGMVWRGCYEQTWQCVSPSAVRMSNVGLHNEPPEWMGLWCQKQYAWFWSIK